VKISQLTAQNPEVKDTFRKIDSSEKVNMFYNQDQNIGSLIDAINQRIEVINEEDERVKKTNFDLSARDKEIDSRP
jgi:cell fate (sporulation/competence/biofilm development) regulator YlbF (YheA/YmcA/DUF963 family)